MRRWGKRGSVHVKLHRRGWRTPLPSIHLANLNSLPNKTDELLLVSRLNKNASNSTALCFTKTWLNGAIPAEKSCGGGMCFYINERWCTDVTVLKKMCCSESRNALHQLQAILLAARVLFINSCEGSSSLPVILLQCGKVWKTSPVTRHHPPALWRINNRQTIWMSSIVDLKKHPTPTLNTSPTPAIQISEDKLCQALQMEKSIKVSGPDGVTPVCLKSCADQLAFKQIFKRSLELCKVPSCFTCSTIIRPVALMYVGMKVIWKTGAGPPEEHHWTLARSSSVCLQSKQVCRRCSQHGSLTQLSMPTSIFQWITSFLTDRQQLVRLGKLSSSTRTISTGAPQGCVLSPLLFSLYTNDCTSKDPSVKPWHHTDRPHSGR